MTNVAWHILSHPSHALTFLLSVDIVAFIICGSCGSIEFTILFLSLCSDSAELFTYVCISIFIIFSTLMLGSCMCCYTPIQHILIELNLILKIWNFI